MTARYLLLILHYLVAVAGCGGQLEPPGGGPLLGVVGQLGERRLAVQH